MYFCYFSNVQKLRNVIDKNTTQLFIEAAERWPDQVRWQVPVNKNWIPVTWAEYSKCVFQIAAAIHSLGYRYEDKIGILAPNSIEWIYCALGIMTVNTILVPIYSGNTPKQSNYVIRHSDLKVLFTDNPETVNRLESARLNQSELELIILFNGVQTDCDTEITVLTLNEMYDKGEQHIHTQPGIIKELAEQPQMNDVAYMIYTSGTTGLPKGVPLSHKNLAVTTNDWLSVNGPLIPDKVVDIHWLPNSHIYGWGAVGLGNIFGFESYLGTPLNVLDLLPILRPHIFLSVPAYFEKLFILANSFSDKKHEQKNKLKVLTGGRLHFLLSGGAGLKQEIKEFFMEAGMWITEGYGLSECSPTLTMNQKHAYRFDSVGLPFPSVDIKLTEDGEILAKGDNIFSGYYKDKEATKAAFTNDGWFKTGDIGEWLDGRFLKIIGRKKEIIITSGGKNIAPQNIELRFNDDPYIEHLVVYGDGKKYLVALITLNQLIIKSWASDWQIVHSSWEELCKSREVYNLVEITVDKINTDLASFETIKYFMVTPDNFTSENGLLTASLKIRREKVYELYGNDLEKLYKNSKFVSKSAMKG